MNREMNTGGYSTSASIPSASCSRRRCAASPVPATGEPSSFQYDWPLTRSGRPAEMFCPLCTIGLPSTSQPSPPAGSLTRRGAWSRYSSGTWRIQASGGISRWPSAETTP